MKHILFSMSFQSPISFMMLLEIFWLKVPQCQNVPCNKRHCVSYFIDLTSVWLNLTESSVMWVVSSSIEHRISLHHFCVLDRHKKSYVRRHCTSSLLTSLVFVLFSTTTILFIFAPLFSLLRRDTNKKMNIYFRYLNLNYASFWKVNVYSEKERRDKWSKYDVPYQATCIYKYAIYGFRQDSELY